MAIEQILLFAEGLGLQPGFDFFSAGFKGEGHKNLLRLFHFEIPVGRLNFIVCDLL